MKWLILAAISLVTGGINAQELFVFTEPASNMAAKSLGVRTMLSAMKEMNVDRYNVHVMPEVMYGINNKLMAHINAFISNRGRALTAEGFGVYGKYKFLNRDEVKKHFRMSAFGRYSYNNSAIYDEEINLLRNNTGIEAGVNATQLLNKVAISSGISYQHAFNNTSKNPIPDDKANKAVYYTLSFGKLMLPKEYKGYNDVNLNLMCEFLAQTLLPNGKTYIDIGPSVQLIFKSRFRVDMAYRKQLFTDMQRMAANGYVLKVEYNFFNAF